MTPEDPPYSAGAKSITHPDFEPVWSAAEDLGMAAFGHFGFSKEKIHVGWAHNGRGLSTYNLLSHMLHFQTAPQLLLGAMIFDGLFERHPKLTVVMEEVGIDWLPYFVSWMDRATGKATGLEGSDPDDEKRRGGDRVMTGTTMVGETYTLPLALSEYLRRQVRVSPLVSLQRLHPVLDEVPSLLCFSSDYPHVEGLASAVQICDEQLVGESEEVRTEFFGGVGELIGV